MPKSEVVDKLTEIEAHLALELGEYAKARALLEPRKDLTALYARALFALGAYEELVELPAKNLEALQGHAHLKLKNFEKARALFERAEPSKNVLIGSIDTLLHLGKKSEAIHLIDQLLPHLDTEEKAPYLRLKAHLISDKIESIEILRALVVSGFSAASEDLLSALSSIEDPKERLSVIEIIEPHVPEQKSELLAFWKGHTLAALGEYSRAKEPLRCALETEKLPKEFEEKVRAALIYIAEKMGDTALADSLIDSAKEPTAQSAALDLKWRLATAQGNHTLALRTAHEALKRRSDIDKGLLLVAHSAYNCQQMSQVALAALRFIDEGSAKHREALERLLELAAAELKEKEVALDTLQKWQEAFGEKESLQSVQSEILISLGRKKEAAALLEKIPAQSGRDSLLCLCYSPSEPAKASALGESALAGGALRISKRALHLELFNIYCDIASKKLTLPKGHPACGADPLDLAAKHLYAVCKKAPDQISLRNRVWLCTHLLANEKTKGEGLALFSHIPNPSPHLICAVARATPKAENSKKLLQQALAKSEQNGDLSLACTALTALGEVALKMGEKGEARTYFNRAAHMRVQSYDADIAKLALYRLDAASGQIEIGRAKSDLKDIQLRKTLEKEPLFLDAALLYVDICADNSPEKKQRLLEQMQEDFCSDSTLFGKHYQQQRATLPEKDQLLANYMLFVDLSIESIAAREDKRRLRMTLAKLEGSAPALKATSPELALRCYELQEQIRSVLQ